MTPIKYRVNWILHKVRNELEPLLQCRVKWGSSRFVVAVSTGYRVNPERWDPSEQRCRKGSFHGARRIPAATINAEIQRYESAVEDVFKDFAGKDLFPSVPDLRAALQAKLGGQASIGPAADVLGSFDAFVQEQGSKNSWSDGTYAKMRVVRHHLAAWRPALSWKDFDEAGLSSYVTFLREKKGHQNATVKKQIGYLRWFLAWAERKGHLADRTYLSYRPKLKGGPKPVIYLTWDELMKVWDAELDGHQAKVRDIFCFCCFSSLRYSDAMNLRWSDVGEKTISLTTVKTADPIEIQLNAWSSEILWRYVDEGYEDDKVFPAIPNQVMNRYLHDICEKCGIDEPVHRTWYKGSERHDEIHPKYDLVTTHAGRRTFIVNALAMGISPTVVMQWTGHSDYDAMKPYIAVADSTKEAEMAKFDMKKDTVE